MIDETGKQLGVMIVSEALRLAHDRGLDLVEVSANADPPVCRIIDYGKFMYQKTKKEREARKGQKSIEIKEMRIRPKTNWYHTGFKLKRVRDFLKHGNKIRVRVLFRAREITHLNVAREIMEKVAIELADAATVEQSPVMDGRSMIMQLSPGAMKGGADAARAMVKRAKLVVLSPDELAAQAAAAQAAREAKAAAAAKEPAQPVK